MDITFSSESKERMRIYARALSFYTNIDAVAVAKQINAYIDLFDVINVSKDDLRLMVKRYLFRLSFYTDIYVDEVYKKINARVITPLIIPL